MFCVVSMPYLGLGVDTSVNGGGSVVQGVSLLSVTLSEGFSDTLVNGVLVGTPCEILSVIEATEVLSVFSEGEGLEADEVFEGGHR